MPGKPKVLIADDEPGNRELLLTMCEGMGLDAVTVVDGREAVERLEMESFDLVVTDLHMPYRNGDEVARATRRLRPHAKVLVLSASWTEEERARASEIPCDAFMSKPFEVPEVLDTVRRFLKLES
ncbi:MAG: response regulator [Planctomycetes bacterium]|nr:response regulator [Planctomycetota bacterium]